MAKNKGSNTGKPGREQFSSRLGFILISAGCAIGLGNVWKFPYEVGQYGGGAFLILYVICLVLIGIPIMTFEFAVGRASQKSNALAYNVLEPKGTKWHRFRWVSIAGQFILMMFYTTVCGWMLNYVFKEAGGFFNNANAESAAKVFTSMTSNHQEMIIWMIIVCIIGMSICAGGLQKGVEKITKVMMLLLLIIMIGLACFSMILPGAEKGLQFYLMPDFGPIFSSWENFSKILYQAMSLAFFTLSVGMGSMVVFGSYINKDRSLFGEALTISFLDVGVAIIAGLIIFPACFAYNVNPGQGPSLVFETLPVVFANIPNGSILGALFFVFLSFAALSTVIAVFENIVMFFIEYKNWGRSKSISYCFIALVLLSIPCALGFNLWNGIAIPGLGLNNIMEIEDFIISNNILPLGGIFFVIFCTSKKAWGWKNSIKEINTGKGTKYPYKMYYFAKFVIPVFIIFIFVMGWINALTHL